MSYIIHIETATEVCSVALSKEDRLIDQISTSEHHKHSKILVPFVNEILSKNNLTVDDLVAVSFSAGPGSYTGLRVGCSTAKGLCFSKDLPLIACSTLQSLAKVHTQNAYDLIIPTIDARRMEVYSAFYNREGTCIRSDFNQIITEDWLEELSQNHESVLFCGNSTDKIEEINRFDNISFIKSSCDAALLPGIAWDLFLKKEFVDVAYFTPFYLKSANITIPKKLV